ncbi:MAG: methyltransferase domain-containing protein [Deltaproteobacteria bacterium]|nr:methyltransferase domain-containing protein [Deltaproteobacteria bacterium]
MYQCGRRSSKLPSIEYDGQNWKQYLLQAKWKRFKSLHELLLEENDHIQTSIIEKEIVRVRTKEYYRYRMHALQSFFRKYGNGFDEVYEIGSGAGFNLFTLYESKQFKKLHGLEISENGIEASKQTAHYFKLDNVYFSKIDLRQENDPSFKLITNKLVFSYYCLEQLKKDLSIVIDNIIKARPSRVIHIEPVPLKNSLLELNSYFYSLARDYSRNLTKELEKKQQQGLINILNMEKCYYAPTIRHFPTIIVWEPRIF